MALSDYLGLGLQIGSTLLSAGGSIARGEAYRTAGRRRRDASEFEARQLDYEAEQALGLGARGAADEIRKANLVKSAALARAAASGAGASDPTVMNIIARTAGEGSYRAAVAMYEGEAQARLDRLRAAGARYEGAVAEADAGAASSQAGLAAGASLLSGGLKAMSLYEKQNPTVGASLYDKYWSGPKADTSSAWLDAGTSSQDIG